MAVVTHSLTHSLAASLCCGVGRFPLSLCFGLLLCRFRCFVASSLSSLSSLCCCSFVRSFVRSLFSFAAWESWLSRCWVVAGWSFVGVVGCPGRGRGRGRRGCVRADGSIPSADFVVLGRVCSSRQFVAQASCSVWWYADRCSVCVSRRSSLRCGPGTGVVGMTDRAACFCPRRVLWTDQPTNYAN